MSYRKKKKKKFTYNQEVKGLSHSKWPKGNNYINFPKYLIYSVPHLFIHLFNKYFLSSYKSQRGQRTNISFPKPWRDFSMILSFNLCQYDLMHFFVCLLPSAWHSFPILKPSHSNMNAKLQGNCSPGLVLVCLECSSLSKKYYHGNWKCEQKDYLLSSWKHLVDSLLHCVRNYVKKEYFSYVPYVYHHTGS